MQQWETRLLLGDAPSTDIGFAPSVFYPSHVELDRLLQQLNARLEKLSEHVTQCETTPDMTRRWVAGSKLITLLLLSRGTRQPGVREDLARWSREDCLHFRRNAPVRQYDAWGMVRSVLSIQLQKQLFQALVFGHLPAERRILSRVLHKLQSTAHSGLYLALDPSTGRYVHGLELHVLPAEPLELPLHLTDTTDERSVPQVLLEKLDKGVYRLDYVSSRPRVTLLEMRRDVAAQVALELDAPEQQAGRLAWYVLMPSPGVPAGENNTGPPRQARMWRLRHFLQRTVGHVPVPSRQLRVAVQEQLADGRLLLMGQTLLDAFPLDVSSPQREYAFSLLAMEEPTLPDFPENYTVLSDNPLPPIPQSKVPLLQLLRGRPPLPSTIPVEAPRRRLVHWYVIALLPERVPEPEPATAAGLYVPVPIDEAVQRVAAQKRTCVPDSAQIVAVVQRLQRQLGTFTDDVLQNPQQRKPWQWLLDAARNRQRGKEWLEQVVLPYMRNELRMDPDREPWPVLLQDLERLDVRRIKLSLDGFWKHLPLLPGKYEHVALFDLRTGYVQTAWLEQLHYQMQDSSLSAAVRSLLFDDNNTMLVYHLYTSADQEAYADWVLGSRFRDLYQWIVQDPALQEAHKRYWPLDKILQEWERLLEQLREQYPRDYWRRDLYQWRLHLISVFTTRLHELQELAARPEHQIPLGNLSAEVIGTLAGMQGLQTSYRLTETEVDFVRTFFDIPPMRPLPAGTWLDESFFRRDRHAAPLYRVRVRPATVIPMPPTLVPVVVPPAPAPTPVSVLPPTVTPAPVPVVIVPTPASVPAPVVTTTTTPVPAPTKPTPPVPGKAPVAPVKQIIPTKKSPAQPPVKPVPVVSKPSPVPATVLVPTTPKTDEKAEQEKALAELRRRLDLWKQPKFTEVTDVVRVPPQALTLVEAAEYQIQRTKLSSPQPLRALATQLQKRYANLIGGLSDTPEPSEWMDALLSSKKAFSKAEAKRSSVPKHLIAATPGLKEYDTGKQALIQALNTRLATFATYVEFAALQSNAPKLLKRAIEDLDALPVPPFPTPEMDWDLVAGKQKKAQEIQDAAQQAIDQGQKNLDAQKQALDALKAKKQEELAQLLLEQAKQAELRRVQQETTKRNAAIQEEAAKQQQAVVACADAPCVVVTPIKPAAIPTPAVRIDVVKAKAVPIEPEDDNPLMPLASAKAHSMAMNQSTGTTERIERYHRALGLSDPVPTLATIGTVWTERNAEFVGAVRAFLAQKAAAPDSFTQDLAQAWSSIKQCGYAVQALRDAVMPWLKRFFESYVSGDANEEARHKQTLYYIEQMDKTPLSKFDATTLNPDHPVARWMKLYDEIHQIMQDPTTLILGYSINKVLEPYDASKGHPLLNALVTEDELVRRVAREWGAVPGGPAATDHLDNVARRSGLDEKLEEFSASWMAAFTRASTDYCDGGTALLASKAREWHHKITERISVELLAITTQWAPLNLAKSLFFGGSHMPPDGNATGDGDAQGVSYLLADRSKQLHVTALRGLLDPLLKADTDHAVAFWDTKGGSLYAEARLWLRFKLEAKRAPDVSAMGVTVVSGINHLEPSVGVPVVSDIDMERFWPVRKSPPDPAHQLDGSDTLDTPFYAILCRELRVLRMVRELNKSASIREQFHYYRAANELIHHIKEWREISVGANRRWEAFQVANEKHDYLVGIKPDGNLPIQLYKQVIVPGATSVDTVALSQTFRTLLLMPPVLRYLETDKSFQSEILAYEDQLKAHAVTSFERATRLVYPLLMSYRLLQSLHDAKVNNVLELHDRILPALYSTVLLPLRSNNPQQPSAHLVATTERRWDGFSGQALAAAGFHSKTTRLLSLDWDTHRIIYKEMLQIPLEPQHCASAATSMPLDERTKLLALEQRWRTARSYFLSQRDELFPKRYTRAIRPGQPLYGKYDPRLDGPTPGQAKDWITEKETRVQITPFADRRALLENPGDCIVLEEDIYTAWMQEWLERRAKALDPVPSLPKLEIQGILEAQEQERLSEAQKLTDMQNAAWSTLLPKLTGDSDIRKWLKQLMWPAGKPSDKAESLATVHWTEMVKRYREQLKTQKTAAELTPWIENVQGLLDRFHKSGKEHVERLRAEYFSQRVEAYEARDRVLSFSVDI